MTEKEFNSSIIYPLFEFFALAVSLSLVPAIVSLDKEIFLHGSSEKTITEMTQETLLFIAAAMFGFAAWQRPQSRSWLILVTGLLACMFIREMDMWLDRISKGFWVYPATLTAAAAIGYAARNRQGLFATMAEYASTRSHAYIATGLLIILVFSRLFGTGSLWEDLMAEHYQPAFKRIIQEGIELLGYILLAFGSACYFLQFCQPRPRRD
jgi:hypothetical protein